MVVVCLPVWAGWDVVMLAVGVCRGGVFSPGLGGRCLAGCGGAGLVAGGGRRCDGVSAAAGGPAVLGRGCERVACEGMWGRRGALAVASGAVFEPGRVEVAVREVLRGAVGVARGEGEAWAVGSIISAMSPWSLVRSCRASLAAVSAAAPWPGWASLVRSDSHLVCSSCCQLQASLLAEVTGCVWSDGAFRFSSRRFSSLFHRVRPRVPWGCRGAPLWCSPLPFRSVIEGLDRGVFSELGLSTPINYGAKVLVKLLIVQMKTCFSSSEGRFLTFETTNAPIFGLRRGKNWHFMCRRLVRISLKT